MANTCTRHSATTLATTLALKKKSLTHWDLNKMDCIYQTTFWNACCLRKRLWSKFRVIQLSISRYSFRQYLGNEYKPDFRTNADRNVLPIWRHWVDDILQYWLYRVINPFVPLRNFRAISFNIKIDHFSWITPIEIPYVYAITRLS